MKIRYMFVLWWLRVVYGCVESGWTVECSGLNLTDVPTPEDVNHISNDTEGQIIFNLSSNILRSPLNFSSWPFEEFNVLDLSHNDITYVNTETFAKMVHLKVINLSSNRLNQINFEWDLMPHINVLDLSNNQNLRKSVNIFKNLHKSFITHLNLSSTRVIIQSPDAFLSTTSLKSLDLSNNELNYIPNLPANLEFLNFSNNSILHIDPDCFDKDTRLKTLLLEHNRNLNEIRYTSFDFLKELRYLSFKGCKHLSHLPTSLFYNNKKLEHLSLAECSFKNVSEMFKSSFLTIKTLELENNPWHCGSSIKWFAQLDDHIIFADNVRCATPENISLAEYLGPKVKHKVVRILLTIVCVILFCMLITAIVFSCNMENIRRKTLNTYSPLDRTSKPYRGSMIYVTSSV